MRGTGPGAGGVALPGSAHNGEPAGGAREVVLVHSSDLHLDDPGSGAHEDGLEPLREVLAAARRVQADVLVLAGDIFDHNRQPLALLDRAARLMGDAPFRIVLLPGNHDPLTPDSAYRRGGLSDPPNVYTLGISVDEAALFPDLELEVWGRPHMDYGDMSPLRDPRARSTRWQVAVAHGHFMPAPPPGERFLPAWRIYEEELAATGADYVALGHWNRAVQVGTGPVPAFYSGSPDLAGTVNVVRLKRPGGLEVVREALVGTASAG